MSIEAKSSAGPQRLLLAARGNGGELDEECGAGGRRGEEMSVESSLEKGLGAVCVGQVAHCQLLQCAKKLLKAAALLRSHSLRHRTPPCSGAH